MNSNMKSLESKLTINFNRLEPPDPRSSLRGPKFLGEAPPEPRNMLDMLSTLSHFNVSFPSKSGYGPTLKRLVAIWVDWVTTMCMPACLICDRG